MLTAQDGAKIFSDEIERHHAHILRTRGKEAADYYLAAVGEIVSLNRISVQVLEFPS